MANIDENTLEYIEILSKVRVEKPENTMEALKDIIAFFDKINEVDTESIEPLYEISENENVFREDEVINCDGAGASISNGPQVQDNAFVVPRTVKEN